MTSSCSRIGRAAATWVLGLAACLAGTPAGAQALRNPSSFQTVYSVPGAAFLGRSILQTDDGGYVMVGEQTTTAIDMVMLRLDAAGAVVWQKVFRVSGQYSDGWRVQQTSAGFIVAAVVGPSTGTQVLTAMSIDRSGNLLWQATYPTGGAVGALPWSIEQTADGGYLLGAMNFDAPLAVPSPLWVLKLDPAGSVVWQNLYGMIPGSIHATPDNGAIATGFGPCTTRCSPWVVKLGADGNPEWQHEYPVGTGHAYSGSVRPTADGGYLLSGNYYDGGSIANMFVVKLDAAGQVAWRLGYAGDPCGGGIGAYDAQPVAGGYLLMVAAGCTSAGIAKVDPAGALLWQESTNNQRGLSVLTVDFAPTRDGGYVAAGSVGSATVLPALLALKVNRQGDVALCQKLKLQPLGIAPAAAPAVGRADINIAVAATAIVRGSVTVTGSDSHLTESNACKR